MSFSNSRFKNTMLLLTASIKRIKCYHNNRWKMCLPKRCCPYRYQKITNKMIPTMWMTWLYLPSQMCSSTNPSLDKSWSHWVRLMKADASITPRSQMTKQFLKIKNTNSSKINWQIGGYLLFKVQPSGNYFAKLIYFCTFSSFVFQKMPYYDAFKRFFLNIYAITINFRKEKLFFIKWIESFLQNKSFQIFIRVVSKLNCWK